MPGTSAAQVLEEIRSIAHSKAGVPFEHNKKPYAGPLVPIQVTIEREGHDLREAFLVHLEESGWDASAVAVKLCSETPSAHGYERIIEEHISTVTRQYNPKLGGEGKRYELEVHVRVGDLVLHDVIEWDMNTFPNTPLQYAAQLCEHMQLGLEWYEAITAQVQLLLEEIAEDQKAFPNELRPLPPLKKVCRAEPLSNLLQITRYDPEDDQEAARKKRRMERCQQWRAAAEAAKREQEEKEMAARMAQEQALLSQHQSVISAAVLAASAAAVAAPALQPRIIPAPQVGRSGVETASSTTLQSRCHGD